jgi:FMN phosphatase YigB (HAD superfamily)
MRPTVVFTASLGLFAALSASSHALEPQNPGARARPMVQARQNRTSKRAARPPARHRLPYERVVLDFDGVWTDTTREARPWGQAHDALFCRYTGVAAEQLARLRAVAMERVRNNLEAGWERRIRVGGKQQTFIVAPATSDPYVFELAVKQEALRLGLEQGLIDPATMRRHGFTVDAPEVMFERMYHEAQREVAAQTAPQFRPGAGATLSHIARAYGRENVAIVTNSGTDAVRDKLAHLAAERSERGDHLLSNSPLRVVGDAKKYEITPGNPAHVEPRMQLPGLQRPVHLQRGHYAATLASLWGDPPVDPRRVAVVGDIAELDLLTPHKLGGPNRAGHPVILLRTDHAGQPEVDYLQQAPDAHVAENYRHLLTLLGVRPNDGR